MPFLITLWTPMPPFLRGLFRGDQVEQEFREELDDHPEHAGRAEDRGGDVAACGRRAARMQSGRDRPGDRAGCGTSGSAHGSDRWPVSPDGASDRWCAIRSSRGASVRLETVPSTLHRWVKDGFIAGEQLTPTHASAATNAASTPAFTTDSAGCPAPQ